MVFFGDLAQILRIGIVKVIKILVFRVCSLNTIYPNVTWYSSSLMSRKAFIYNNANATFLSTVSVHRVACSDHECFAG